MTDEPGDTPKAARLEVKIGADVHVVLEGDPAFVMEAYRQVREDVAKAAAAAAAAAPTSQEAAPVVEAPAQSTAELPPASRRVLWLYRCDDEMRTVYAAERAAFASSQLAQRYRLGRVDRVYVEDDRILRALRHGARTLWRELGPEAAEKIKAAGERADKKG